VRGGGGGVWYTGLMWLEMWSSAAIKKNDGKLAQAIPTICTYN
jgi:hypothetical protein